MAITKQQVEQAIANIDDGGMNTAEEMRDVLEKLLEYAAQTGSSVNTDLIKFKALGIEGEGGNNEFFSLSLSGFKERFVSIVFELKYTVSGSRVYDLKFPFVKLNENNEEKLEEIFESIGFKVGMSISFTKPLFFNERKFYNIPIIISNSEDMLLFRILHGDTIRDEGNAIIRSSIVLHGMENFEEILFS